ncbi:MAG TPA: D-lyxose/D-mannose family sugar isomerase [Phycisphaerae bacterium]|nr:D-lyxose/D-mannose family sugar isomerase [Phycisphaerales bacterium]HRX85521.1 D-lyxose/D-mannose family sugar isomerase [Phycisphaerae bacterium]
MKRSQINRVIDELIEVADREGFKLPPFAGWSPEDWKPKDAHYDHIRRTKCGWDVTDYGSGDFRHKGLVLLTMRNGYPDGSDRPDQKSFCEKIMLVDEQQVTPTHFHHRKTEDIINRGGGRLVCKVWKATEDEKRSDEHFELLKDGAVIDCPPGAEIALDPGESVTFRPRTYHEFWAAKGTGKVLAGEVSSVNDDEQDNRFLDDVARFPDIEEDEAPRHLLVSDY